MLELLRSRRSIRKLQNQPVEQDKLDRLVETLLRALSSRSLNPWEFIVVDDTALLEKLAQCKPHGAAFLNQAPVGIVIAADPAKCDVWIEDCSIASILVQMEAQALGLGSCRIQIRMRNHDDSQTSEDYIKQLLGIPDNFNVLSIIAIGYPAEEKYGHPRNSLEDTKIHRNKFFPRSPELFPD